MDDRRFDQLSRALALGRSRRQVLKGLLGLGAATVAGDLASETTSAARRPTPTPRPVTCPGVQVWTGAECACPEGRSACGPACCDTPAACCDNACCPDGTVCIGEEICCPAEAMCGGVCCQTGACIDGICCDAAFVCGGTCCTGEGNHCCDGFCQQCCSDAHCAPTEYCSDAGVCVIGCNEDSDCAHLSTDCLAGACQNNVCVTVDTCETGSCCGSACLDCASESTFCLSSVCDPATSSCLREEINHEQTCAEADNLCVDYRCRLGRCTNVKQLICPPQTPDGCAASQCDPTIGECGPAEPFAEDGTPCPGGTCAGGVCCTGCNIDGVCYQEGDTQPGNLCNSCQTFRRRDGWFPISCSTPGPIDWCQHMACNPDTGECFVESADDGETCPMPTFSQCIAGECQAGRCEPVPAPDDTVCTTEESPNFCAAGGVGVCQAGQCIAGVANEGKLCKLDLDSTPACGSFVCRAGACTREPMNTGIDCTLAQPIACHEQSGTCNGGFCQTEQFPTGTVCGKYSLCVDAICSAEGTCSERATAPDGAVCRPDPAICSHGTCKGGTCQSPGGSEDQCPDRIRAECRPNVTGTCDGNGTCMFSGRGPSFGHLACGAVSDEPDDSRCCPGQVCICPPLGDICLIYGCWYPEDIPVFG